MNSSRTRREFLLDLGICSAALPFVLNLPSLGFANQQRRKQRLVIMFSPNGVWPPKFWPEEEGELTTLSESLESLEPFKNRTLLLHGIGDHVQSVGEAHQRGIGCLLTGVELLPGTFTWDNAGIGGWANGISIDQEIKNHLQRKRATRTRFGSLEFGVLVPDVENTWTRLSYAGPNKPIAPISDPYQMFAKLYGRRKDQDMLKSVLDDLQDGLRKVSAKVAMEDRRLLEEHTTFVREMEQDLQAAKGQDTGAPIPKLGKRGIMPKGLMGAPPENVEQMPRASKMQIDLLVSSLAADFARVATLQFTNSVGYATLPWRNIDKPHHVVAHAAHGGGAEDAAEFDKWFCEQLAYLARKLAKTPEPGGGGSLLDNTLVVWANEHGSGGGHSTDNLPFVLVGNGLNFRMGRMVKYEGVPHHRLLLSLAHGMGHEIKQFGNPTFCEEGVLPDLT